MQNLITSLRAVAVTMLVCCVGYFALIWGFANILVPGKAEGSLIEQDGRVIGSEQIAQAFTQPRYFWPRPSAVGYNGAGAGGSNLSPANPLIRERAETLLAAYDLAGPLPADLVTASGSGLDPHITLDAALAQILRVSKARGMAEEQIERLVREQAGSASGIAGDDLIVNVLLLNLVLDQTSNPSIE